MDDGIEAALERVRERRREHEREHSLPVLQVCRDVLTLGREVERLRKERAHYMALSAMNDAEALRSALVRALNLLRIGMDVGLEPRERDEANALLALFGHEPVTCPTDSRDAAQ